MEKKLQDSGLKAMNVIWRKGEIPARRGAEILGAETGWNVNTTYTLIKRCSENGAVGRVDPNFVCRALVSKEDVQRAEAETLGLAACAVTGPNTFETSSFEPTLRFINNQICWDTSASTLH
jgi:predicted transcriptional regulator